MATMLLSRVTRQLTVTATADRARRERKWDVSIGIDASYAFLSVGVCPAQPPRCYPSKDSPARIQENDISQYDCEQKLESAFLFWYGAEIPRKQCRVLCKVQGLSEVRQVIGGWSNGSATLFGEDRFDLGQISVVGGL